MEEVNQAVAVAVDGSHHVEAEHEVEILTAPSDEALVEPADPAEEGLPDPYTVPRWAPENGAPQRLERRRGFIAQNPVADRCVR